MKQTPTFLWMTAVCLFLSVSAAAGPKPRWAQRKGAVAALNKERSNDSYRFVRVEASDTDLNRLVLNRLQPLMTYVGDRYRVRPEALRLDSLTVEEGGRATYRIAFTSPQGEPSELFAQLVDDWTQFEDNIDSYAFNQYQLYAVSEPNAVPTFDTFGVTEQYGGKAVLMSLIPGLGQLHKGQTAKGYTLLGSEAVLVGGVIYSSIEMGRYNRLARQHPDAADSYYSNAATFRSLRNCCAVLAGGLYLYNLIDAAVSKGARRVVVTRANRPTAELAFVPVVTPCGTGVGLSVKF